MRSQTVNSMVVRDKHFDVFTENKRDGASSLLLPLSPRPPSLTFPSAPRAVTTLHARHSLTGAALHVAYVQVGALLVASISRTARLGKALERGDELGSFGESPSLSSSSCSSLSES